MSSTVTAKCPQCKHEVTVNEDVSAVPVTCEKCQTIFTPATVVAESNKKFEIGMYVVMGLIGAGLIAYMIITGEGLPKKANEADAPAAVENADSE